MHKTKLGMHGILMAALMNFSLAAFAQTPAWKHQNGSLTSNGAVVVKSLSGGTYNATQNPTGAVAKINQSAASQGPTIILQATAQLPIVVEGAVCDSSTDTVGILADRSKLETCQSNVWTPAGQWKDPVANYGSLPVTGNKVGDVRVTSDTARAFMWNGGSWAALAVDQNGRLTTGSLQITDVVTEGTGCPSNGLVARNAAGLLLSCQSGVWEKPPQNVCGNTLWTTGWGKQVNNYCAGGYSPYGNCPPGYSDAITGYIPNGWTGKGDGVYYTCIKNL